MSALSQDVKDAFLSPYTEHTRRVDIYEADGTTPWMLNAPITEGSVSLDYGRDERRSFDLTLDNEDGDLSYNPNGFWYDKVLKIFRGVNYTDSNPQSITTVRHNLQSNPSFEISTSGWINADNCKGGALTRPQLPYVGSYALGLAALGVSSSVSVSPSKPYTSSAYVKAQRSGQSAGIFQVKSPTVNTPLGPWSRYQMAKNGPGRVIEEFTNNLLLNPNFEGSISTYWGASNCTLAADDTVFLSGTRSCKGTLTAASGGIYPFGPNYGPRGRVPCRPSLSYTASVYILASTHACSFKPNFEWYSADGTRISTVPGAVQATQVGKWIRVTITANSPANAYAVTPTFYANGDGIAGDVFWFDCAQLEQKQYVTSYADGSMGTGYAWEASGNKLTSAQSDFEDGTTGGWSAGTNWTVANSTAQAKVGTHSLLCTRSNATAGNGYASLGGVSVTSGQVYTFSAFVYASAATKYRIQVMGTSLPKTYVTYTPIAGGWDRLLITFTATATETITLFITDDDNTAPTSGSTIYLDAIQFEQRNYATTYGNPGSANAATSARVNAGVRYALDSSVSLTNVTIVGTAILTSGSWNGGNYNFFSDIFRTTAVDSIRVFYIASGSVGVQVYANNAQVKLLTIPVTAATGDAITYAVTYDGANLTLWVQVGSGAPQSATTAVAANFVYAAAEFAIGYNPFNSVSQSNCVIENFMAFSSVLSTADILAYLNGDKLPSTLAADPNCKFSGCVNDPQPLTPLSTTKWTRVSQIRTTTPSEAKFDTVIMVDTPGGSSPALIDAVLTEQRSGVLPYFDGDTVDQGSSTFSWDGTVGLSASTQSTITTVKSPIKTTWETQLGEFMIDKINEAHFPHVIKVSGRDYAKKMLLSKFVAATGFANGDTLESVIAALASNAGVPASKRILPVTGQTLGRDFVFDRGVSRWEAAKQMADSYGYELFFDAAGDLVLREYRDPTTSPVMHTLATGADIGNLVSYEKSVNDSRLYNHIVVSGEASDTVPVWAEARNDNPASPTNIDRIGDRLYQFTSSFITQTSQAQNVADKFLAIHSLEEYEINFDFLMAPWLEVGEIVQFIDPRPYANQPDRFLLDTLSIPLALGAMSGTGKRVMVVG